MLTLPRVFSHCVKMGCTVRVLVQSWYNCKCTWGLSVKLTWYTSVIRDMWKYEEELQDPWWCQGGLQWCVLFRCCEVVVMKVTNHNMCFYPWAFLFVSKSVPPWSLLNLLVCVKVGSTLEFIGSDWGEFCGYFPMVKLETK